MAESRLQGEKTKSDALAVRQHQLEQEVANLSGRASNAEQSLKSEKQNSAQLAADNANTRSEVSRLSKDNESAQARIARLEKELADAQRQVATVTSERDTARAEAKRARSWHRSFLRVWGVK